jgi:hypothetical protein
MYPVSDQQPPDLKINPELLAHLACRSKPGRLQRLNDAPWQLPVLLELRLIQWHAILFVAHQNVSDRALPPQRQIHHA